MTHLATDEIPLQVALLGPPQIRWRSEPLPLARRQVRGLLFYLAHGPAPAPRDRLSFLFWPELHDGDARAHLKRLLSTLGSALSDGALLAALETAILAWWEDADAAGSALQRGIE